MKKKYSIDVNKGFILTKEPFPICDRCGEEKTLCECVDTHELDWFCESCDLVD